MSETAAASYVMGYDDRERRRLATQASILRPFTEDLFRRAGITTGMHVLDVGCGVGDVSLIAARLAGRTGSVTSIDIDPAALQTLRDRADAEGIHTVRSVEADIQSFDPGHKFDAVVGRHILIHTKDPLSVLTACRDLLHPRGIAAFQEYDFQQSVTSWPPLPLRDAVFAVFNGFFAQAVRANMGSRLFSLFMEAGFEHPDCRGEFPVDGGVDSPHHEVVAESLRSILPRAKALNIPGAADIDMDTIESRLREEAQSGGGSHFPVMFSCFSRRR
jgi:ubiquinone/menaquinone biosynthesis C-methylase UbiE